MAPPKEWPTTIAFSTARASISAAIVRAWPNGVSVPSPRSDQPRPGRSTNNISARPSSSGRSGSIWSRRLLLAPWMKRSGGMRASAGPGTWTKCILAPATSAKVPQGGLRRAIRTAPTRLMTSSASSKPARAATIPMTGCMSVRENAGPVRASLRSNALARKLVRQCGELLLRAAQHRVDVQHALEGIQRRLLVSVELEDGGHARKRAEMAWLEPQRVLDIGHRLGMVVHHEVNGRAAVPAFGEVGRQHRHLVQEVECCVETLGLHRVGCALHQKVDGGRARLQPFLADLVGDTRRGAFVALALEGGMELVEPALIGLRVLGLRRCRFGGSPGGRQSAADQAGCNEEGENAPHAREPSPAMRLVKLKFV